jgi:predicted ATPase
MLQLGYPDRSLRMCEDGQQLANSLSHPFSIGVALWASCLVHHLQRDHNNAFQIASSLIELSADGGFSLLLAQGKMLRGWSVAAQGDHSAGIQEMKEGMEQFRAGGAQYSLPCFLGVLGQYCGEMGEPEQGLRSVQEGLAIADGNGDHFNSPELHRLKGELLLAVSRTNYPEAKACFQKAIDIAATQKARLLEVRACNSLATLCQDTTEASEAMNLLAAAYDRFDEGFGTPDLTEAKATLKGA